MGHAGPIADQPLDEPFDVLLHEVCRRLDRGLLGLERRIAAAADHEPAVWKLMPVVVAPARVVRALVEALVERLCHEHLTASGLHHVGELGQQPSGEPVPGDNDHVGVQLADSNRIGLPHIRSGGSSVTRQPPDPARGLKCPVRHVVDRTEVETVERRREVVDPFDGEPVLAQRVVLSAERFTFGLVDREPQAAHAPECVARELCHAIERAFRELHHEPGAVCSEQTAGLVVRRCRTAQCEPAVAPARAAGDLTSLVQAHTDSALGQGESAGAARHAAADHRHLGAAVEPTPWELSMGLLEPI